MEYTTLQMKLNAYKGIKITEKKIRELSGINDYSEYCQLVLTLVQDNIIEPINDSGPNGMNPTLYKRYKLIRSEQAYEELIPEIRLLHSAFNIEGYLNQPAKYKEHKIWIDQLDAFIKINNKSLNITVSINERSFQIFHLEKALKVDMELAGVLNFNRGIRDFLNYYMTPEPFFTHNVVSYNDMELEKVNILISENKDTWYTLRKIMQPHRNELFGIPFHILLFGEGKKINRKSSTLTDYDKITLEGFKSTYYYFGDIDYEGISIYNDLKEHNKTLDIQLMTPLYSEMLLKSEQTRLPITKDHQNARALDNFLACFEEAYRKKVLDILCARQYVPQEILNYGDFIDFIEKGE